MDPDGFFVQGAEQNRAKTTCVACPVKTECLADALDNRIDFGVWGGMTERERRRLLRRHPHVTDWAAALRQDRKSTRLNSSHVAISYAVFCLKKKTANRARFAAETGRVGLAARAG